MLQLLRSLPPLVLLVAVGAVSPAHAAPTIIADPWFKDSQSTDTTVAPPADSTLQSEIVRDRWYLDIDPASVHQRYIDATNRGDVAAAVALFAQDAVYQGGSCQPDPCVGQVAIQGDIAGNVASHAHVTRISAQVQGDTLTWRSEVVADGVRAAGVDRIVTFGTTQVRDATIVKHQFRFDVSDPQTAVYAAFLATGQPQPAAASPNAPTTNTEMRQTGRRTAAPWALDVCCWWRRCVMGALKAQAGPSCSEGRHWRRERAPGDRTGHR